MNGKMEMKTVTEERKGERGKQRGYGQREFSGRGEAEERAVQYRAEWCSVWGALVCWVGCAKVYEKTLRVRGRKRERGLIQSYSSIITTAACLFRNCLV